MGSAWPRWRSPGATWRPLELEEAQLEVQRLQTARALVPLATAGVARDAAVWRDSADASRAQRGGFLRRMAGWQLGIGAGFGLAQLGSKVLAGMLSWNKLDMATAGSLRARHTAANDAATLLSLLPQQLQRWRQRRAQMRQWLTSLEAMHAAVPPAQLRLNLGNLSCTEAQTPKHAFGAAELLRRIDAGTPGHYLLQLQNGGGKSFLLGEICRAYPGRCVAMRGEAGFVAGDQPGSELSEGMRLRARMAYLKADLDAADILVFDETASKLTGDNLTAFKRAVVAQHAQTKVVLEVHQGLAN